MKKKIMLVCITAITFLGLSNLSSSACPCTGDSSPCTCGSSCSCDDKK